MGVALTESEQLLLWRLLCAEYARRNSHLRTMRQAGYKAKVGEVEGIAAILQLIERVAPESSVSG